MATQKQILKYHKEALKRIKEHELIFISDVIAVMPFSQKSFYNYFPKGSELNDEIQEALDKNRIHDMIEIRRKWKECENPTAWLMHYKLITTDEQRLILSNNYTPKQGSANVRDIVELIRELNK